VGQGGYLAHSRKCYFGGSRAGLAHESGIREGGEAEGRIWDWRREGSVSERLIGEGLEIPISPSR